MKDGGYELKIVNVERVKDERDMGCECMIGMPRWEEYAVSRYQDKKVDRFFVCECVWVGVVFFFNFCFCFEKDWFGNGSFTLRFLVRIVFV